jgi:lantibiotic biosynthesis protein
MKNDLSLNHHNMFLARTPLLPLTIFQQWSDANDKQQFVREMINNPAMLDALYLASPSLFDRYQDYFGANATDTTPSDASSNVPAAKQAAQKLARKVEETKLYFALCKYLARAAYRCTPFGMFASVTLGDIGAETALSSIDQAEIVPRIRLDFGVQAKIVNWLLSDAALRQKLCYQTNSSLATHGKKIYFVEGINTATRKQYQLNQVERNEYLDSLLAMAQQKTPFEQLCAHLMDQTGASLEEATPFLNELIDSEILVPDLGIQITSTDSFSALALALESIGERHRIAALEQLLARLNNDENIGATQTNWAQVLDDIYHAIAELKHFEIERKNVFQADCKRIAEITLSNNLADRIGRVATLLSQLTMRRASHPNDFKRRFQERFGDKEVALDLLFNEELGIPYSKISKPISELLSGVEFPRAAAASDMELHWNAFDSLLFKKFEQTLTQGEREISISEQEIKAVYAGKNDVPPLRGGMYVQATLFAPASGQADSNDSGSDNAIGVYIQTMGGGSGVELLGRFCDLDNALTQQVRTIIAKQDQDDETRIHAEVVHLPQDRLVNIVARPTLSNYEIVYLGNAGITTDRQIPVSDLLVSLHNGQFILRSKRLNKQVIPRLTSAHNIFGNNLGLYQFLGFLARHDQPQVSFEWSGVFRNASFLPRVTIENVVVSLATWRLLKTDLDALRLAQAGGMAALQAWRLQCHMPRFISHDMHDNVLPIDLDNELMVQMLLDEVSNHHQIDVKEALPLNANDDRGTLGQHNMEVIIPFQVQADGKAQKNGLGEANPSALPRPTTASADSATGEPWLFIPGSAWCYFKIYCGHSQVDELISHYLAPVMRTHLEQGLIEKWFFIRYADPDHHLRIRAFTPNREAGMAIQAALSGICQTALKNGFGWKVVSDSYEREVVRYGGLQGIGHCEDLFHLDSELIVDFISSAEEQIPVAQRWLFAVFCVSSLLDGFELNLAEKTRIIDTIATSFRNEFHFGARQKVQLGTKYRSYRTKLDKLVFERGTDAASIAERAAWMGLIERYQAQVWAKARAIKTLSRETGFTVPLEQVIASLIHMHCNRLFIANPREHEVVFYDFLDRILENQAATQRTKP